MKNKETLYDFIRLNNDKLNFNLGNLLYFIPIGGSEKQKEEYIEKYQLLLQLLVDNKLEEAITYSEELHNYIQKTSISIHHMVAIRTVVHYIWNNKLESEYEVFLNKHRNEYERIKKCYPRKSSKIIVKQQEIKKRHKKKSLYYQMFKR